MAVVLYYMDDFCCGYAANININIYINININININMKNIIVGDNVCHWSRCLSSTYL
jgi:hypothetical protein